MDDDGLDTRIHTHTQIAAFDSCSYYATPCDWGGAMFFDSASTNRFRVASNF